MFPPLWVVGAFFLIAPLRASQHTELTEAGAEKQEHVQSVRRAEMKWAKRCLIALSVLLLVIIGILRALHVVFKLIRWFSRKLLTRLEDYIIDWGGDEEVQEEPAPPPAPAPAAQ